MSYTDAKRAADYRAVFGTEIGRKVLTDIMVRSNVFAPVADADPIIAARKEGARHLALNIASFVRWDADQFLEAWRNPEDA